ncbi:MAG: cellulase family glycosylhydrolase [Planctomycetota bacterium]
MPDPMDQFVRVSPRDSRYLELTDGTPYVPIGLNMIRPPKGEGLEGLARWLDKLAASGGNYFRIWLSNRFFDIEHEASGLYDESRAERIDAALELARQRGIRVKMCIEHFRHLGEDTEHPWSGKPLHLVDSGGTAKDIGDFFDGEASRQRYRQKLDYYAARYGDDPAIFAWELWNEIDAVQGGDWMSWTRDILAELHRRFPRNLCVQSLGSFDRAWMNGMYHEMSTMPGNDLAQVHRYLDLGARLEACRGPMDLLAADAVQRVLGYEPERPVLLAESGAVQPRHSGPFYLYKSDPEGLLLHDVLFAPFFAGAAGPGHCWHWDRYVSDNDLWWQFGRFAEAVDGVDPADEAFQPDTASHDRLRVLLLRGRRSSLAWCRDSWATWRSELQQGLPAPVAEGLRLDLGESVGALTGRRVRAYDPWENAWTDLNASGEAVQLPPFRRSLVLRIE